MRCEHFTYGLFNGHGYVLTKTPGVDALVTSKAMEQLLMLTQDTQLVWDANPPYISCTHVEPAQDEYGRQGRWNHTILIELNDFLTHHGYLQVKLSNMAAVVPQDKLTSLNSFLAHTQPRELIQKHFMQRPGKPPRSLEPLTI